jgi:CheY-like chemotaxis protein
MPALVLVAEDENDLREAVVWSLRAAGYRVLGVGSGEAALWVLMTQPIDLLVADMKMPNLDGVALVRLMQADPNLRQVPVVVITAFPDLAPPELAVIAKPFAARVLTDVVSGILAGKPRRLTPEANRPSSSNEE